MIEMMCLDHRDKVYSFLLNADLRSDTSVPGVSLMAKR